jgi:hypothetical protein
MVMTIDEVASWVCLLQDGVGMENRSLELPYIYLVFFNSLQDGVGRIVVVLLSI